jgi:hypothetical protein
MDGSLNLAGISAARALDRVLRAGQYWVPHWYKASHHVAYWDKFSRPETKPLFDRGILDTWWYDDAKAAKLATRVAVSQEAADEPGSRSPYLMLALVLAVLVAGFFVLRSRKPTGTK